MGLPSPSGSEDHFIEVAPGVSIAARHHPLEPDSPMLIHFHGNGEIVSDYDNIAPVFHATGAALFSVDYRGYGKSDGQPTVRALLDDAHVALDFVLKLREERGYTGPLVVMGRSLGSAPAIELASSRGDVLDGLVVESGFAQTPPLLSLFGILPHELGVSTEEGGDNEDKIAQVKTPIFILHAERDEILPLWQGERNFECATCSQKRLVVIPDADHSTIMLFGGALYWKGLADFLAGLR